MIARAQCICVCLFVLFCIQILPAQSTFDGYTFTFSGKKAYLYGMDKTVIHEWSSPYEIEGCADLLRDSSIIVPSYDEGDWPHDGPLSGGRLQIIKWNGTIAWDFLYRTSEYMPHHDIEPVYYTNNPAEKPNFLIICYTHWGDKITELKPTGLNTAEVVWEWWASDHTCDSGTGANKPELIDKGKGGFGSDFDVYDRMHTNNVSFNRTLNQIVIDVKGYNEMMVIDHSTTTAQAKTHSGGKYGKGGDILYRWGNPKSYGMTGTNQIIGQHCGSWIPDTFPGTKLTIPGAGNMICVDNGNKRVLEIVPPGVKNGIYPRTAGAAYGPEAPLWTYAVNDMQYNEGSVQRLPNGNTLICTGGVPFGGSGRCRVFEINASGTVVWDMPRIPLSTEAVRYAYSYLGQTAVGKDRMATINQNEGITVQLDRGTGKVVLLLPLTMKAGRVALFGINGRELVNTAVDQQVELPVLPRGAYIATVTNGQKTLTKKFAVAR